MPHHPFHQAKQAFLAREQRLDELRQEIASKADFIRRVSSSAVSSQQSTSEEIVVMVDDDTVQALECEQRGDWAAARLFHSAAFDRLVAIDPVTESSARGLAAFASFAVRYNTNGEGGEDAIDEEQIAEAFDALGDFPTVADSVACDRAVFLGFSASSPSSSSSNTDLAWDAFKHARDLFPEDVQLLCNYARFVDSVLVQEAEEDGDVACVPELKELASELYTQALDLNPTLANALVNLSAILVEQSRTKRAALERKSLLERARDLLLRALEAEEEEGGDEDAGAGETAMMHYNLACIECLLGGKASAECASHLKRALAMDPSLRGAVVQDPDLLAVRKENWCVQLVRG